MDKVLAQLMAMSLACDSKSGMFYLPTKCRKAKPVKNCMNCGKEHTHNNTCCSSECFKLLKKAKK